MMISVQFVVVLSFFAACSYSYPLNCNQGPTYWCRTAKTAEECGVSEFCKIMDVEGLNEMKKKHSGKPVPASAAPPVKVGLYYEALCGGCRSIIKNQIYPTYLKLKSTGILDIELYPYGNAHEHQDGQTYVFECQHGEVECQVNIVETCALHLLPPPTKMQFIHCIETSGIPSVEGGKQCAIKLGLEWDSIFNCYNGSQGNFLEHQMAEKTAALNPRHRYVPWVTVNGVHTEDIQDEVTFGMLEYVCSLYQGPKPAACKRRREACYKDYE